MLSRTPLSRFEVGAYLMLVVGVVGDHLSTGFALTRGNIREANPFALSLMEKGLWAPTDLAIIFVSIAAIYLLLRAIKNPVAKYMLVYPSIAGVIRLAVAVWNVSLII